jgi:hypothetical protein
MGSSSKNGKSYKKAYFLTFVSISIGNTNNIFAALYPPLKGHEADIFGLNLNDPLPICLELTLRHGEAHQHPFQHRG